ncbi:AAA family ATPase [Campylobacter geochelonis]|uniref:AAA family ATPase n=1 Tax=Campylobacter geochelonis TaxID=1780362 RepID=UPI000770B839|nr:AAA family ATPase [Campylobacter geochelonis]CZE47788.1 DNA repair and recombination protein RadB [Campylobacter geochelonis]
MKNFKKESEAIDLERSNLLLTPKDIADFNPKWLINGFVETNKLISLYAMPGSGKSITALYLAIHMLEIGAIKKVIYVDMDNGLGTLKNRGVEQILIKYSGRLKYISSAKKAQKDIDPKTLIFSLSALADESQKDTLIIFDSIRNFINGSMSYDEVVMPTLDALQNMRDYYAGAWFLNHQNKQDFTGENNKAYKGATVFFDSCDEAYFVKKRERKESRLIVTLEPMKQRDDTKPQALIIDTATLSLKFDDYLLYAMSDKQAQALEYAKDIIKENPNGINLKNLTTEIKRMAKFDEVEICGIHAIKNLLKQFDGKFYNITSSNTHNFLVFYPL